MMSATVTCPKGKRTTGIVYGPAGDQLVAYSHSDEGHYCTGEKIAEARKRGAVIFHFGHPNEIEAVGSL